MREITFPKTTLIDSLLIVMINFINYLCVIVPLTKEEDSLIEDLGISF